MKKADPTAIALAASLVLLAAGVALILLTPTAQTAYRAKGELPDNGFTSPLILTILSTVLIAGAAAFVLGSLYLAYKEQKSEPSVSRKK